MMVYVNGQDITNQIEQIQWSGDENQLARKAVITYLYAPQDPNARQITVHGGDRLVLSDGGTLFDGIILTEERTESGVTMQHMAYDYAWYLKNKILGVFKGSPAEVARQICQALGIACGALYDPGGEVEVISTGEKTAAQGIQAAYEGQDAHLYMDGQAFCVEQYGQTLAGTVTGDESVTDATYKSSAENMVNRVLILDAADQPVGEISGGLDEYGQIQETYKMAGDGKDPMAEARKLMKGLEQSGKITVRGNPAYRTGRAIIVERAGTHIRGRFVIVSDDHSISDAAYNVTLGLRFNDLV